MHRNFDAYPAGCYKRSARQLAAFLIRKGTVTSQFHFLSRRALGRLIGLTAALFAFGMIVQSRHQLVAVLKLADPTGLFGLEIAIVSLLANLSVILIFVGLVHRGGESPLPHLYGAVFALKLVEALSLLPCFIGRPGALCGVASVLVSGIASPFIVVLTAISLFMSKDRALRRAASAIAAVVVVASAASYALVSPKSASECGQIEDTAGRGVCLEKFAVQEKNVTICASIELRSSRFECIRKVAEHAQRADLCEQIHDSPGAVIAAYETPDLQTRSLCYYVLALNMKRHDLCPKIEVSEQRERCLAMIPETR